MPSKICSKKARTQEATEEKSPSSPKEGAESWYTLSVAHVHELIFELWRQTELIPFVLLWRKCR